MYKLAPSSLDYALKCKRCLWLNNKGIKYNAFFPPVFNSLDLIQKDFFEKNKLNLINENFGDGRIMNLKGFITSKTLKDKKNRDFILSGKTDIVLEFDNNPKKYGVIDFKTTSLDPNKIKNYKLQLEAYSTIFENLNSKDFKITNIDIIGLLLFSPKKITSKSNNICNFEFETMYVSGERCQNDLYDRVTEIIDIFELNDPPNNSSSCSLCNYTNNIKTFN